MAFAAWGCGDAPRPPLALPASTAGSNAAPLPGLTIHFGSFSVTREVCSRKLLPQFADLFRRKQGREVGFVARYEGSGTLTRSIAGGFAADVAIFALASDLARLIQAGVVSAAQHTDPARDVVCRSLVVLAVRKGNPLAIRDWSDLVRPGLRIVAPDPETSGGGRWNACAIYGAALRGHAGVASGDPVAARDLLARVMANIVVRGEDASGSFRTFRDGTGDVAITYECEVIGARMFGHDVERVIPASTLLVECPAAVIDANADAHGVREAAEALVQFLHSHEAQKRFAFYGMRPVDAAVAADNAAQFPQPADLWTIADLGGWERATREVLGPTGSAPLPPGK